MGPRVAPPGKPGAGAPHTHPNHAAGGRGPPSAVVHVLLSVLGRRSAA